MKALVEAGADLEIRSRSDISPLIACVMKNRIPIAEYLLSKGAKLDFSVRMSALRDIILKMSLDFKVILDNYMSIFCQFNKYSTE